MGVHKPGDDHPPFPSGGLQPSGIRGLGAVQDYTCANKWPYSPDLPATAATDGLALEFSRKALGNEFEMGFVRRAVHTNHKQFTCL